MEWLRRKLYGAGRGVEPPWSCLRRILSPLRLPVPPSRLYVEVIDFKYYLTLYSFAIQNNECETVKESVKLFADFHRSLPFAHEALNGVLGAMCPRPASPKRAPDDILPLRATYQFPNPAPAPAPAAVQSPAAAQLFDPVSAPASLPAHAHFAEKRRALGPRRASRGRW